MLVNIAVLRHEARLIGMQSMCRVRREQITVSCTWPRVSVQKYEERMAKLKALRARHAAFLTEVIVVYELKQ